MNALRPTRYSIESDSTFFQVGGTLVSVRYEAAERKRWGLLREPYRAQVAVSVDDGAASLEHEYPIPPDLRVGPEIGRVERELYRLIDEAIRAVMQLRTQEHTERAVRRLESEHLYRPEGAGREKRRAAGGRSAGSGDTSLLEELGERLVTAVRHVTKVTSLSVPGLQDYQREQAQAYERFMQATGPGAEHRMRGALQAVEAFVEHEADEVKNVKRLKERAREYVGLLVRREGGEGVALDEAQRRVIVEEFVPAYAKLRRDYRRAGRPPANLIEHAFGSFFGGGVAGLLVIELFGENLLEGLLGMPIDLPGWWIGAGVAFFWPYLRLGYGLMMRQDRFERDRERLLERTSRRLNEIALPPGRG